MGTLSVVVSVFNGEKYLETCLESVKNIAQEIIVVDHNSTDNSISIAKKYTKKIFKKENNPQEIDLQKNFGFQKATQEWILSLDADEAITQVLAKEIQDALANPHANGYYIPRKNIIFRKWIQYTGWYPDYQLRLFKNGKGQYISKHVHEELVVTGNTEKLLNPLIHEAYQTIYQFLHRGLTIYAPNEAETLHANGYVFSFVDAIRFPAKEFLSRFFARYGYKDGFHGLILSLLMAAYHLAVFSYLWEYEKFKEQEDTIRLFSNELQNSRKDFEYWLDTQKIENSKNPASKMLLRAKRKLRL